MSALTEAYEQISRRVLELNTKLKSTQDEISRLSAAFLKDGPGRIAKLTEQMEKIDEYLLKIKGFQELAQKNLDSQNVLTIEAPPGYRVNLNRLRNWAMMIDPMSSNDPYAQRLYVVAKCDQCFLEQKREEFKDRISRLQAEQAVGTSFEIEELKKKLAQLREELKEYAMGPEIAEFARSAVAENRKFWNKEAPGAFKNAQAVPAAIAPGAFAAPLSFEPEQCRWLKTVMGDFYDADGGRVLLPAEIGNQTEYVMAVTCVPTRRKKLDRALQNLVLATINENPAGTRRVLVLDGMRFNSSSIGSLRQLEGTFALEQIPRNPEQLTAALEQLVSSFADMDELLDTHDSVAEYNDSAEKGKRLAMTTVVVIGWPGSYEGRDRELLQRIMTNYERYGISLVTVTYQNPDQKEGAEQKIMPEYARQNAICVSVAQNETTITFPGGVPQRFTWYAFGDVLPQEYVDSLLAHRVEKEKVGNEYIKRYPLAEIPPYTRAYRKIELPFGIDGKDQAHCVSFENENFATYLVGASRSGKSTLLHTLIAGLIRNYHPDNVELWLADFKQLEFKRYIKHLPPHVKYVLLDESTELVYDLIDKLTAEMMERQKLFSRLGKQRIDQVDPMALDKPLPVIFVILDEFSIMSQSIAESHIYKLRLQNILAKGAALGIKFLFSSQTFTTGVAGLTATARAQIQQRIAMKGSREEISETLELSSSLKTEQVRNWMDALPPHYALVKFRNGADALPQVKRLLVMYFKDYGVRDDMIDSIRASMHASDSYHPSDVAGYCDKHPVLVDGNTFDAFDGGALMRHIGALSAPDGDGPPDGELFLAFGTPRLMERVKVSALSCETRENLLLIARSAEQACAASILLSAAKSFMLQGGRVQLWAYGKDRLFRAYRRVFAGSGVEIVEDMDEVCREIRSLKQAVAGNEAEKRLILLVGMDRICIDFDYVTDAPSGGKTAAAKAEAPQKGEVSTDEERKKKELADRFFAMWTPICDAMTAEGKSEEEIRAARREKMRQFKEENHYEKPHSPSAAEGAPENQQEDDNQPPAGAEQETGGAYNAKSDFNFVVKQGSRLGVHFLLALNAFPDLKPTGLKLEYFRYKMAFQVSADDSRSLFGSKVASTLPERICQFDDTLEQYSFRPYLHEGIEWDGWFVESGAVSNPYEQGTEE